MQVWRRSLSTCAVRLGANSASHQSPILRCVQLLESGKDGAASLEDQTVRINGTIRSVRKMRRVTFADVFDGSTGTNLQVALKPKRADE